MSLRKNSRSSSSLRLSSNFGGPLLADAFFAVFVERLSPCCDGRKEDISRIRDEGWKGVVPGKEGVDVLFS